jgi:hypothetical protein
MCNRTLLGLVVLAVFLGMGKSFFFAVVVTIGFRRVRKRQEEREVGVSSQVISQETCWDREERFNLSQQYSLQQRRTANLHHDKWKKRGGGGKKER